MESPRRTGNSTKFPSGRKRSPQPRTRRSITVQGAGLLPGTSHAQHQQAHRTLRAAGGPGAIMRVNNREVASRGASLACPCPTGLPPHCPADQADSPASQSHEWAHGSESRGHGLRCLVTPGEAARRPSLPTHRWRHSCPVTLTDTLMWSQLPFRERGSGVLKAKLSRKPSI